jgi:hypothetical protein
VGILRAGRRPPSRHTGPRHDARRPPVHLTAGQRLHLPGLARPRRHAALGAARDLSCLRFRGVPMGLAHYEAQALVLTLYERV